LSKKKGCKKSSLEKEKAGEKKSGGGGKSGSPAIRHYSEGIQFSKKSYCNQRKGFDHARKEKHLARVGRKRAVIEGKKANASRSEGGQ